MNAFTEGCSAKRCARESEKQGERVLSADVDLHFDPREARYMYEECIQSPQRRMGRSEGIRMRGGIAAVCTI